MGRALGDTGWLMQKATAVFVAILEHIDPQSASLVVAIQPKDGNNQLLNTSQSLVSWDENKFCTSSLFFTLWNVQVSRSKVLVEAQRQFVDTI